MSMTQLVIGTALGFFVAQGVLYSIRHLIGWLQRSDARKRILRSTPSLGSTFIGAFIKYAAPVGAGAALITLGVWAVGAADRASKYLKADLDVWGFAAWQIRHFPMDGYKGATLPECKDIKDVVDHSSSVDLQSTVAQGKHP